MRDKYKNYGVFNNVMVGTETKMKKKLSLFIAFSVCFFSCSNVNPQKENNQCVLTKLEIFYVDFEIETAFRVECNRFLDAFPDANRMFVTDKKTLKEFEFELKSLKLASSDIPFPDTRIKIKVYKKEKIEEYCIGRFSITNGKELFVLSNSLKELLKRLNVIDR